MVEHTATIKAPTSKVMAINLDDLIRNHGVAVADDPLPPEPATFVEVDDDEINF